MSDAVTFFLIPFAELFGRGKGSCACNSIPVKVSTRQATAVSTLAYSPLMLKLDREDEEKVV